MQGYTRKKNKAKEESNYTQALTELKFAYTKKNYLSLELKKAILQSF